MLRGTKGTILVQVVVMGMLLAMIASYLVQWAFGRAQLVARHQSATKASGEAEGCINNFLATYHATLSAGNALPGSYPCPGGGTVSVVNAGNNNYQLTLTHTVDTY